jgi:hypothetical protein
MEVSNKGSSVYHRFRGHYQRHASGSLVSSVGHGGCQVHSIWSDIRESLLVPTGCTKDTRRIPLDQLDLVAYEIDNTNQSQLKHGILLSKGESTPFDSFFSETILRQSTLLTDKTPTTPSNHRNRIVELLTDTFDAFLRNDVPNDAWATSGRSYFASRVEHLVSRNIPIEFILPAFPCKSSNTDKVAGKSPDLGEELALRRLHNFVKAIEKIYQPGAKIWIVSDGHVFSDCSKYTHLNSITRYANANYL